MPVVENGFVLAGDSTSAVIGTELLFNCATGFVLRGSNIIQCTSEGKWKLRGYCEVACKEHPLVANATVLTDDSALETVIFSCNDGFFLRGSNVLECVEQRMWRVNGHCEAFKCYESSMVSKATQLLVAAENGKLEMLKDILANTPPRELIYQSTWKNAQNNPNGDSPFHRAARRDQVEAIRLMWPCMNELVLYQNNEKQTAIHVAASSNSVQVLEFLIAERPSLTEIKDGNGEAPLHFAARQGHLGIVKLLVNKYNASVDVKSSKEDLENLPIHLAAFFGHLPIVQFFLEVNNTLLDARDLQGNKPIHRAALSGRVHVVEYFISRQNVNVELRQDSLGRTPLHSAASKGHLELVKRLVTRHGANVFAKSGSNDFESIPIHLAAAFGHLSILEFFLGVSRSLVDAKDTMGNRPIHRAALSGRTQVVEYFISRQNVDVEIRQDSHGRTSLHLAAEKGHIDLVKLLVTKHHANVYAASDSIDSKSLPIHLAAWQGRFKVVQFLVETFPDLVDTRDAKGRRPLLRALESGKLNEAREVVALLEKYPRGRLIL